MTTSDLWEALLSTGNAESRHFLRHIATDRELCNLFIFANDLNMYEPGNLDEGEPERHDYAQQLQIEEELHRRGLFNAEGLLCPPREVVQADWVNDGF